MTDRSKFEQMLEYLISEEQDKAREIFHQLVVEKSREIYETILAEELKDDEEDVEESKDEDDEDEKMDEQFALEADDEEGEEEPEGGEDDGEVGGDATDDFLGDVEAGDDSEDGGEGEGGLEDRVMDLEDALDDLRAEFEQMMGDEGSDMGDDMGMDMGGDDMGMDMEMEPEAPMKDSFSMSDNFMREYIEKVAGGHGAEKKASGDNGDNVKSVIDNMKNDMGGTTANIVKGGEDGGKGVQSGLLKPTTKEENFGNVNVPGGKAGVKHLKTVPKGHGAEKKGSGDDGDKSAGSPINGAPKRAK